MVITRFWFAIYKKKSNLFQKMLKMEQNMFKKHPIDIFYQHS